MMFSFYNYLNRRTQELKNMSTDIGKTVSHVDIRTNEL